MALSVDDSGDSVQRVVIVSPHLDDGVLSCGQLMAALLPQAAHLITVFAGDPPDGEHIWTEYDKKCGFPNARVAVARRRAEDRRACSVLRAQHRHLRFVDSQYGPQPRNGTVDITDAIVRHVQQIPEVGMMLGPIGLQHVDHVTVSSAFLQAAQQLDVPAWLYEELPYRVQWPEQVPEALTRASAVFNVERDHIGDGAMSTKTVAVANYRSQLWQLDGHSHLVPERYWRLRKKDEQ